ncbi:MAG: hypothetical protein EZS28_017698, partial [Streblomastix strix]
LQSFGQLVLKLKAVSLPENEQIAVLQRMIFISSKSEQDLKSALESEGIETSCALFNRTTNKRIKQLCIWLVGMIGQLAIQGEDQEQYLDMCILLLELLFCPEVKLQTRGKNVLLSTIEHNESIVQGLLQIGILDRASDALNKAPRTMQESKSALTLQLELHSMKQRGLTPTSSASSLPTTSSASYAMNILDVLDKIITVAADQIPKSSKIMNVLQMLINEGETTPIKRKARNIQLSLEREGQVNATENDLAQAKEKVKNLEQSERNMREKLRNAELRVKQSESQLLALNQQIESKDSDKKANETRATAAEERVRSLEQQSHEKEDKVNTVTQERIKFERQVLELQKQIREKDSKIDVLTKEKTFAEQKISSTEVSANTYEGQIKTLQQEITLLNEKLNAVNTEKQSKDQLIASVNREKKLALDHVNSLEDKVKTLERDRSQKDSIISNISKEKKLVEERTLGVDGQIKAIEQEKQQKEQMINQLNQEKLAKDKKIDQILSQKSQFEQRATTAENRVRILEQDKSQNQMKVEALMRDRLSIEARASELEASIQALQQEKQLHELNANTLAHDQTQKDQIITMLTRDKKQAEDRCNAAEKQIQQLQQDLINNQHKGDQNNNNNSQIEARAEAAEEQVLALQQERKKYDERAKQLEQDKLNAERRSAENQSRLDELYSNLIIEFDLERIKLIPWEEMSKDLEKNIYSRVDWQLDLKRQMDICDYMIEMFKDQKVNDEYRKWCIEAGVAKALLNIFETWKIPDVRLQHARAFFLLTFTESMEVKQLIFQQKPFRGLIHLLESPNVDVSIRGINSISNILAGEVNIPSQVQQHPYFDAMSQVSGIDKIFMYFKRQTQNKECKNASAFCIGFLYRAREIERTDMRVSIIGHLKSILDDEDKAIRVNAKTALKHLYLNPVNRNEIDKGGFSIPK